jgi:DNA mismatch repair protein MutS2
LTFASLEFDRVLALVASFARSDRGRRAVMATLPRFIDGEGSSAFRLTREMQAFIAAHGSFGFAGLDAADLLRPEASRRSEPADFARLVTLVRRIVEVRTALGGVGTGPELARILLELPELEGFLAFCDQRLGPAGEILDTASPALARARASRERSRSEIVAMVEQIRRQHKALSAPFTVRRDRYCVPVPVSEKGLVAGLILDASSSGATVYLEPFAVVELNNSLAQAAAQARAEEERVVAELAAAFQSRTGTILRGARALESLDATQARALFGRAAEGTLLEPGAAAVLRLVSARHPLLDPALAPLREEVLGDAGNTRPVVPLDLEFPDGTRLVLLSGPNAGGKTVALKTVGLAALMAQAGVPVLAAEGSGLPAIRRLWCHLGDEQDLFSDLSTFTGAMRATAALLADAGADTLVLYDELGSGTDPEEGAALAAALLEELARLGCWTLATAHLITVAARLESVPGALNAAMGFDEASGRPTFRFHLGIPGRSRGLAIASSCGVPTPILSRAREMLSRSFLAIDGYLETLQEERGRLALERERLSEFERDADLARSRCEDERASLAAEREKLRHRLDEEREALRRRAREQLAAALAELQLARARGEFPGKRKVAAVRRAALSLASEDQSSPGTTHPLEPGATVRLIGISSTGQVQRVVGERVEVLVKDKRLWVEASGCEPIAPSSTPPTGRVDVAVGEAPPAELKLIGLTQDAARDELEQFLDRALMSGVGHVRIVHGHGTGTLRRVVREVLAHHPGVARFAHPPQHRGGTGVTEAELDLS